jgi:hypothetical protein
VWWALDAVAQIVVGDAFASECVPQMDGKHAGGVAMLGPC